MYLETSSAKKWNASGQQESPHIPPTDEAFKAEILDAYVRRDILFPFIITTATSSKSENIDKDTETLSSKDWDFFASSEKPAISTEQSRQREVSISKQIDNLRKKLDVPFAYQLAGRLEYLDETSKEEFPEQAPISPRSLEDFIAYILSIKNITYPGVVLTYSGNIRAEWTISKNKHFAVEFLGNNDVHFVVFSPDPKDPFKINRASGQTTVGSLMNITQPHGITT